MITPKRVLSTGFGFFFSLRWLHLGLHYPFASYAVERPSLLWYRAIVWKKQINMSTFSFVMHSPWYNWRLQIWRSYDNRRMATDKWPTFSIQHVREITISLAMTKHLTNERIWFHETEYYISKYGIGRKQAGFTETDVDWFHICRFLVSNFGLAVRFHKTFFLLKTKLVENLTTTTNPLCVTRTCRRPSFLNMSITVSIGVWSVTVIGARSKIRLNFKGGDPCHGEGILGVNKTSESSLNPSCVRLAFARRKIINVTRCWIESITRLTDG